MTDHADSTPHNPDPGGARQPGEDQLTDDAYRDGHGEVQPDPDAGATSGTDPDSGVLDRQRRQVDDVESGDDQADNEVLGTVED